MPARKAGERRAIIPAAIARSSDLAAKHIERPNRPLPQT